MKSLVLGIMITSVSISFAQSDGAQSHQLKKRFEAKKMMAVERVADDVHENATSDNGEFKVLSRKDVKSSVVSGVIRMDRGAPIIVLNTVNAERRLLPMNLPKAMAVDGQEIQLAYMVTDARVPKSYGDLTVVGLYDVSMSPRK